MTNPPMPQGGIPHKEISREALERIVENIAGAMPHLSGAIKHDAQNTLAAAQTALALMDEAKRLKGIVELVIKEGKATKQRDIDDLNMEIGRAIAKAREDGLL